MISGGVAMFRNVWGALQSIQNFYTVENTREESWTDDSYMTQFEREKPSK